MTITLITSSKKIGMLRLQLRQCVSLTQQQWTQTYVVVAYLLFDPSFFKEASLDACFLDLDDFFPWSFGLYISSSTSEVSSSSIIVHLQTHSCSSPLPHLYYTAVIIIINVYDVRQNPFLPHRGCPKHWESTQWTTKPHLLGAKQLLLRVPYTMSRLFLSCRKAGQHLVGWCPPHVVYTDCWRPEHSRCPNIALWQPNL